MSSIDKKLVRQVRRQMEFYFSEGNLPKDNFMQEKMAQTDDNSIAIEFFFNFNKLRQLTTDTDVLIKAVKKSSLLGLTEGNAGVFRVTPLRDLEDVDERTIYLANIPADSEHSTLKDQFSQYGEVLYVSLPKFKTSGDLRGFGFIEFDTVEASNLAASSLRPESRDDQWNSARDFFSRCNKQSVHLERLAYSYDIQLPPYAEAERKSAITKGDRPMSTLSKVDWLKYRSKFRAEQEKRNKKIRSLISAKSAPSIGHLSNQYDSYNNNYDSNKASSSLTCLSEPINEPVVVDTPIIDESTTSFTVGMIVLVTSSIGPLSKKTLRSSLASHLPSIAYIDVIEGADDAFLRCNSVDSAKELVSIDIAGLNLSILCGNPEMRYWEKISRDRSSRKRRQLKKRKLNHDNLSLAY